MVALEGFFAPRPAWGTAGGVLAAGFEGPPRAEEGWGSLVPGGGDADTLLWVLFAAERREKTLYTPVGSFILLFSFSELSSVGTDRTGVGYERVEDLPPRIRLY